MSQPTSLLRELWSPRYVIVSIFPPVLCLRLKCSLHNLFFNTVNAFVVVVVSGWEWRRKFQENRVLRRIECEAFGPKMHALAVQFSHQEGGKPLHKRDAMICGTCQQLDVRWRGTISITLLLLYLQVLPSDLYAVWTRKIPASAGNNIPVPRLNPKMTQMFYFIYIHFQYCQ